MFYTDQTSMYYYEDHYDLDAQNSPPAGESRGDSADTQTAPVEGSNALDLSLNHALDLTAKPQVSLSLNPFQ